MTTAFRDYTNSIANEIIALSRTLDHEVETWSDVVARVPDSTSKDVSVGFVSKPATDSTIELVIDVQAPPTERIARLRIWAIETVTDSDDNERFNNIQLTYGLDYDMARKLVGQASITREDIAALVHDTANQLNNVAVSDLTGQDAASGERLGTRYDLESDDLTTMSDDIQAELTAAIASVLERLKQSAAAVSKS